MDRKLSHRIARHHRLIFQSFEIGQGRPVPGQPIAEQLAARSQENLRAFEALDEHDWYVYHMR